MSDDLSMRIWNGPKFESARAFAHTDEAKIVNAKRVACVISNLSYFAVLVLVHRASRDHRWTAREREAIAEDAVSARAIVGNTEIRNRTRRIDGLKAHPVSE
jgi:hypothetical protein